MSSPEKKKQKMEEPSSTPESNPIPSLPDNLLVSCFARVSRLYYPTLSLVSKTFRSLLASPELYKARSLLDHTERCLYVCIQPFDMNTGPTWFTLCRKPNQTNQEQTSRSGYVLAKVPVLDSPRVGFLSLVSIGSDIFNIGSGSSYYLNPSSSVWVLDCRSHTWQKAPSMKVELVSLSATVVDEKIYVAGSQKSSKNSLQVLDTRRQVWDPLPCNEAKPSFVGSRSAHIKGKLHLNTQEGVFCYSSDKGRWYLQPEPSVCPSAFSNSCCEVGNVLYSYCQSAEALLWYDDTHEEISWTEVEGLVGLPKFPNNNVRLADFGGKMAVFWVEYLPSSVV